MTLKPYPVKTCLLLIIILLAASAFALLGISYLPFELVKAKIDAFDSVDGNAEIFTIALFEQIIIKFRFVSVILLLVSGILYIGRRQAQQHLSSILTSVLISFISFSRALVSYFYMEVGKEDRTHLTGLFIIMLLAVSVRLCVLFQPIRYDEAATFLAYASKPLFIGLSNYATPNNHLFHTFLVHMVYLLFGNQPWVLRLPALFAGILLVPATYIVTRIFYNKHAALLAAGFVASSSTLIDYSTNARGYTIICLIFFLILALGTYLTQSRNLAAWLLFAILSALGFFTIPVMLYPFGIVLVWIFLSIVFQDTNLHRSLLLKDLFISLTVMVLLTFILYVPVFTTTGFESVIANQFVSRKRAVFLAAFPPSVYSVWSIWNRDIPTAIKLLLVAGFFTSLVFHKRLTSYRVPIILPVIIWLIPLLIVQRVVPFERVWLFLLPLYIALASSGVSYLLRPVESKMSRHKPIMLTILSITLSFWLSWNVYKQSVYYSHEAEVYTDAEAITIFLKDYLKPEDNVLVARQVYSLYYPLEYYFYLYHVPAKYLRSELNSSVAQALEGIDNVIHVSPAVGVDQSSRRILLIANKPNDETLKGILDEGGMLTTNLMVPKIIQRYKSATLYEINRDQ